MNKCKDLIKEALKGRSPYAMSGKLGVTPQSIYSWIRGDRIPSFSHLAKIASKLDIPLAILKEAWGDDELSRR